jgi:P27 family predicted phage terminase small subunit
MNPNEPEAKAILPDPPDYLAPDALAFWRKNSQLYYDHGLLTDLSVDAFAVLCQRWGRYIEAERELNRVELTDETYNGTTVQHPLVGTTNKAFENYLKIAKEFGGTPSSLAGVTAVKKKDEKKGFAAL